MNTTNTVLTLLGIFIFSILFFCAAAFVIKLYKGCSYKEAVEILRSMFNSTPTYRIDMDMSLRLAIDEYLKKIIGDNRFYNLKEFENMALDYQLIWFGMEGQLPVIRITVDSQVNKEEKAQINNLIIHKLFKSYLIKAGYSSTIKTVWRHRGDIRLPYIQAYFSGDSEQELILRKMIQRKSPY